MSPSGVGTGEIKGVSTSSRYSLYHSSGFWVLISQSKGVDTGKIKGVSTSSQYRYQRRTIPAAHRRLHARRDQMQYIAILVQSVRSCVVSLLISAGSDLTQPRAFVPETDPPRVRRWVRSRPFRRVLSRSNRLVPRSKWDCTAPQSVPHWQATSHNENFKH